MADLWEELDRSLLAASAEEDQGGDEAITSRDIEELMADLQRGGGALGGGALGSGPAAPAGADTACCGREMRPSLAGILTCEHCGRVRTEEDASTDPRPSGQAIELPLRIVGVASGSHQNNLWASGNSRQTPEQRIQQIYNELVEYRNAYLARASQTPEGTRPCPPLDACTSAAENYAQVVEVCVKRSQNKKVILAYLLWLACLQVHYAPRPVEIADFMQLSSRGFASGGVMIRRLVQAGHLPASLNSYSEVGAQIRTFFRSLGMEGARYSRLEAAVEELVTHASRNFIGDRSHLHTRIAGGCFEVIRRCRDPALVPAPVDLSSFCARAKTVRAPTVELYLRELAAYHSKFEPLYERLGLVSTVLPTKK